VPDLNESKPVLVIYASRFGHSHRIAEHIAGALVALGQGTEVVDVRSLPRNSAALLRRYRGVALVASVQYGHLDLRATRWVKANLPMLQGMPTLLVTVSLTARKYVDTPPADVNEHVYTRKFLEATHWRPDVVELAAGKLEYPRYNLFDRKMIQLIMHISHGPTDGVSVIEYTNWERLTDSARAFAKEIA